MFEDETEKVIQLLNIAVMCNPVAVVGKTVWSNKQNKL